MSLASLTLCKFILKAGKKRRQKSRRDGEEGEKALGRRVTLSAPGNIGLLLTPPLLDRTMTLRYSELSLSKLRMCHLSRQGDGRCDEAKNLE